MLPSWLPEGGGNLFQAIKKVCVEAEASGQKLIKLSIGQPQGPALYSARKAAAEAVMSDDESMHEYQDNGCPGVPDFARRFVQRHVKNDLDKYHDLLDYLPIPGIKPMLGLIPLACNAHAPGRDILVASMTNPGYPVPHTWCGYLKGVISCQPELSAANAFRLRETAELVMTNYPHNPSGQVATAEYWHELCQFAIGQKSRLFNDAAYSMLAYDPAHCTLADVAVSYPALSWMEAFSASKAIGNGTGWRIGAIVGSLDFVGDLKTIKGNTDSGLAAPLAYGALYALEHDSAGMEAVRTRYKDRLDALIRILTQRGMRLAVQPGAGFFTLWDCPKGAFGQSISSAEEFNYLMIRMTGLVGVHFDPYIRYAVCGPIDRLYDQIDAAFEAAHIEY